MVLKKLTKKLLPLVWKCIPGLSKLWQKQNGHKTQIGIGLTVAGVGLFLLGAPEIIVVGLVIDGIHQTVNALAHKADKKIKGE